MKTIRENEHTKVIVLDEPDQSGACHEYEIHPTNEERFAQSFGNIFFQKGPIKENGVNGCQIEDLLAICIHRLEGFQAGPFPCDENEKALSNINTALAQLNSRTLDRQIRGVEGENKE